MLFGMSYLPGECVKNPEIQDMPIKKYILVIGRRMGEMREKGMLAQSPTLMFKIHQSEPGDCVMIRTWRKESLTPLQNGPFPALLVTETAVRMVEKGWMHATRIKGPAKPPAEWNIVSEPGASKLHLKKTPL